MATLNALPQTMPELQALYARKDQEYRSFIFASDAASKLPQIRKLNQELNRILNAMLELSAQSKRGSVNFTTEEQDLLAKLRKIEKDAGQLASDRDKAETLRRIRADEESRYSRTLYFYIGAVLLVALLILLVMFVFSGKKSEASTPMPMSPMTTPPLM